MGPPHTAPLPAIGRPLQPLQSEGPPALTGAPWPVRWPLAAPGGCIAPSVGLPGGGWPFSAPSDPGGALSASDGGSKHGWRAPFGAGTAALVSGWTCVRAGGSDGRAAAENPESAAESGELGFCE